VAAETEEEAETELVGLGGLAGVDSLQPTHSQVAWSRLAGGGSTACGARPASCAVEAVHAGNGALSRRPVQSRCIGSLWMQALTIPRPHVCCQRITTTIHVPPADPLRCSAPCFSGRRP
jgi:hypothetical protein